MKDIVEIAAKLATKAHAGQTRPARAQKDQPDEPRGYRRLKERPTGGIPGVYVSIHHGCGGWNSAVWGWEADPEMTGAGFYQPLNSGVTNTLGRGTREEAVAEATSWAEAEGLPLWIPEGPGEATGNLCGHARAPAD